MRPGTILTGIDGLVPHLPFHTTGTKISNRSGRKRINGRRTLRHVHRTHRILQHQYTRTGTIRILNTITTGVMVHLSAQLLGRSLTTHAINQHRLNAPASAIIQGLFRRLLSGIRNLHSLNTARLTTNVTITINHRSKLGHYRIHVNAITRRARIMVRTQNAARQASRQGLRHILLTGRARAVRTLTTTNVVRGHVRRDLMTKTRNVRHLGSTHRLEILSIILGSTSLISQRSRTPTTNTLRSLRSLLTRNPQAVRRHLGTGNINRRTRPRRIQVSTQGLVRGNASVLRTTEGLSIRRTLTDYNVTTTITRNTSTASTFNSMTGLIRITLFNRLLRSTIRGTSLQGYLSSTVILSRRIRVGQLKRRQILQTGQGGKTVYRKPCTSFFYLSQTTLTTDTTQALTTFSKSVTTDFASVSTTLDTTLTTTSSY